MCQERERAVCHTNKNISHGTCCVACNIKNDFELSMRSIDKLAELSVRTGLALESEQDLLITAPIEALPLVRQICIYAYKAGAGVVTPIFTDPEIILARYKHALDSSFDASPAWLFNGIGEAFDANTSRLAIVGDDPMLLSKQDPEKVGRVNKANSLASKPVRERITRFDINWNIISWPGRAWAKRMFPDMEPLEAQTRLSEAIFLASKSDFVSKTLIVINFVAPSPSATILLAKFSKTLFNDCSKCLRFLSLTLFIFG